MEYMPLITTLTFAKNDAGQTYDEQTDTRPMLYVSSYACEQCSNNTVH